jgi:hypothetical protein
MIRYTEIRRSKVICIEGKCSSWLDGQRRAPTSKAVTCSGMMGLVVTLAWDAERGMFGERVEKTNAVNHPLSGGASFPDKAVTYRISYLIR